MGTGYDLKLLFNDNCKMVNNLTTTKAREKISTDLEFLEFLKCFNGWAKFKTQKWIYKF
jgi:hypothetical protein